MTDARGPEVFTLDEWGRVVLAAKDIVDNTAPVSVALIRQMMWKMLTADHPMEALGSAPTTHPLEHLGRNVLQGSGDAR